MTVRPCKAGTGGVSTDNGSPSHPLKGEGVMSYQTVKAVKNLELASVCNLACPYCPAKDQHKYREVGLMNEEVFDRSLYWIRKFVRQGTQQEINMFGVGESTLHPKLIEFVRRTRKVMPRYLRVLINTNGVSFTEEICRDLYDAGVDKIDLTDHEAYASRKTISILRKVTGQYSPSQAGKWGYSRDGILHPNDWGGIVKGWVEGAEHPRCICPWLNVGQVMIASNGDVLRCCQDAFARGVICTVFDDVENIPYSTFIQCATCHEIIPDWITKHQEREAI